MYVFITTILILYSFIIIIHKWKRTDQRLIVDLLSDQFVLAEGVTGFSGDRVDRPFLHLLLHGTVQHEQRLASTLLQTRTGGGGGSKKNIKPRPQVEGHRSSSNMNRERLDVKLHRNVTTQVQSSRARGANVC